MDTLKIAIDALLDIKNTQGKVCSEYEICTHTSCQSSYNSWAIADKALREIASKQDVEADEDGWEPDEQIFTPEGGSYTTCRKPNTT